MKKGWKYVHTAWLVASSEQMTDESGTIFLDESAAIESAKMQSHHWRFPFQVYRVELLGTAKHGEPTFKPASS